MKNFKVQKTLFFLNASINKMVPKGSGNEKSIQTILGRWCGSDIFVGVP